MQFIISFVFCPDLNIFWYVFTKTNECPMTFVNFYNSGHLTADKYVLSLTKFNISILIEILGLFRLLNHVCITDKPSLFSKTKMIFVEPPRYIMKTIIKSLFPCFLMLIFSLIVDVREYSKASFDLNICTNV